jgi:hypothetical protein
VIGRHMVARPVLPFSASSRGARANVLLPIGALGSRARSVVTNSRGRFRTLEIGGQLSNEVTRGSGSAIGCRRWCVQSHRLARPVATSWAAL